MCSESYTFELIPQEELEGTFKTTTNGKRRARSANEKYFSSPVYLSIKAAC